jgi:hypothetical protein
MAEKPKQVLHRCTTCEREVSWCAGCERDRCKTPLCTLCLYVLLGQSERHPHVHGG